MTQERTTYHFERPRSQRAGSVLCRLPLGLVGLSLAAVWVFVLAMGSWWAIFPLIVSLLLSYGFLYALVRYILFPHEKMCLAIEERGIGFGKTEPDLWIFSDGIDSLVKKKDGWYELHHVNGTFLTFPSDIIDHSDVDFIHQKIDSNKASAANPRQASRSGNC